MLPTTIYKNLKHRLSRFNILNILASFLVCFTAAASFHGRSDTQLKAENRARNDPTKDGALWTIDHGRVTWKISDPLIH